MMRAAMPRRPMSGSTSCCRSASRWRIPASAFSASAASSACTTRATPRWAATPQRRPWAGCGRARASRTSSARRTQHNILWQPQIDNWAFGVGTLLGTMEGGVIINMDGTLILELPGPRVAIVMNMRILSPPPSVDQLGNSGGILAIIEITPDHLLIGAILNYNIESLIKIEIPVESFFNFHEASDWHYYLGQRSNPVSVTVLDIVKATGYLMLKGNGLDALPEHNLPAVTGFAIGAGAAASFTWGDTDIGLYLRVAGGFDAVIGFDPFLLAGQFFLSGELRLFIVSVGASAELNIQVIGVTDLFDTYINGKACGHVDFFFFSVEGCVSITINDPNAKPGLLDLVQKLSLKSRSPALLVGTGVDRPIDTSLGQGVEQGTAPAINDPRLPVVPIEFGCGAKHGHAAGGGGLDLCRRPGHGLDRSCARRVRAAWLGEIRIHHDRRDAGAGRWRPTAARQQRAFDLVDAGQFEQRQHQCPTGAADLGAGPRDQGGGKDRLPQGADQGSLEPHLRGRGAADARVVDFPGRAPRAVGAGMGSGGHTVARPAQHPAQAAAADRHAGHRGLAQRRRGDRCDARHPAGSGGRGEDQMHPQAAVSDRHPSRLASIARSRAVRRRIGAPARRASRAAVHRARGAARRHRRPASDRAAPGEGCAYRSDPEHQRSGRRCQNDRGRGRSHAPADRRRVPGAASRNAAFRRPLSDPRAEIADLR